MAGSTVDKIDNKTVSIGVNSAQRTEVAKKLAGFLATTYTLYMKTLYYHWNVTGAQFHDLHKLFESQYEDLNAAGDVLAERIRALGHFTPGTFRDYIKLSKVEEDESLPVSAEQMLKNLLRDNETCSKEARLVLKVAEQADDEVTIDMMVSRMSKHDESAWMLRSIIE